MGPEVDETKYTHVALDELVRLRLRKEGADTTNQIPFSSASSSTPRAPPATRTSRLADEAAELLPEPTSSSPSQQHEKARAAPPACSV